MEKKRERERKGEKLLSGIKRKRAFRPLLSPPNYLCFIFFVERKKNTT
jgi:hypothetical protein